MSRRNPYQRRETENPLSQAPAEDNSLLAGYAQMYGGVDLPPSGRLIANPTPIYAIRPDLRQPRRAIPAVARGQWDGDPADLPTILGNWHGLVERLLGREIDIPKAIRGGERLDEVDAVDPIVATYLALLDLAASIFSDGLVNPIRTARGVIESGERRWLAYHVLNLYSGSDYSKIPAVEKAVIDVWAQAAENGARAPLNAIGMARQLALLIMDMYEGDDGVKFDPYERMVLPGECDRRFYAQVANGVIYRIKRGMMERILNVTGLKSRKQVNQYRNLLTIPDELWQKADVQDWAEGAIRQYLESSVSPVSGDDMSTIVDISDSDDGDGEGDDRLTTVNLSDSDEGDEDGDTLPIGNLDAPSPAAPAAPRPTPKAGPTPPPRTSIGERQGLYTRSVAPTPPPPIEDDTFTEEDAQMVQQSLAAVDADLAAAIWWEPESTAPICAEKQWADAAALMRYLKAQGDGDLKKTMTEMLTVSREDLRKWMQADHMPAWWEGVLTRAHEMARQEMEEQWNAMVAYFAHLNEVAAEMNEKRKRQ
jgi:hypothetical protein